jgi:hypothetical protein
MKQGLMHFAHKGMIDNTTINLFPEESDGMNLIKEDRRQPLSQL